MRKAIARFAVVTIAAPVAARALQRIGDTIEHRQGRRSWASDAAHTASRTLSSLTSRRRRWY